MIRHAVFSFVVALATLLVSAGASAAPGDFTFTFTKTWPIGEFCGETDNYVNLFTPDPTNPDLNGGRGTLLGQSSVMSTQDCTLAVCGGMRDVLNSVTLSGSRSSTSAVQDFKMELRDAGDFLCADGPVDFVPDTGNEYLLNFQIDFESGTFLPLHPAVTNEAGEWCLTNPPGGSGLCWRVNIEPELDGNCDGIDQDENGLADDGRGGCLVRFAFYPVCFDGTDADFAAQANAAMDTFRGSLGLDACPQTVGARIVLPSEIAAANGGVVPCLQCPTEDEFGAFTAFTTTVPRLAGVLEQEFSALFGITDRNVCGSYGGAKAGTGSKFIWGEVSFPEVFPHEFGHVAGLDEEYCSKERGGGPVCGDAQSINALSAERGCDPAICCSAEYRDEIGVDPARPCATEPQAPPAICCPGNLGVDPDTGATSNARCFMTHGGEGAGTAWCAACLGHWRGANQGLSTPLVCDGLFPGTGPILDWTIRVPNPPSPIVGATAPRLLGWSDGVARPSPHHPGNSGELRIVATASDGRILYEGYRDIAAAFRDGFPEQPTATFRFQAPLAAADVGTRIRLEVFRGTERWIGSTLYGAAPTAVAAGGTHECSLFGGGAEVTLDASRSSDADGDVLTYDWSHAGGIAFGLTPTVTLEGLGDQLVTVVVSDGVFTSPAQATHRIVDTTPPILQLREQDDAIVCAEGEEVTVRLPMVSDVCSPTNLEGRLIASSNPAQTLFVPVDGAHLELGVGTHTIEWIASDESGNETRATQALVVLPAFGTLERLEFRDRATLRTAANGWAAAFSDAGRLDLGVEARTGSLFGRAAVALQDRARIEGRLVSPSPPTLGNSTVITGGLGILFPWPSPEVPAFAGSPGGSSIHLEPDRLLTIGPGNYGSVHVKSRSELILAAGTYRFSQLTLEPDARLRALGPVTVVADAQFIDRGRLVGFGSSRLVLQGNGEIVLETSTVAELYAASARLMVRGTITAGRLLARELILDPDRVLVCDSTLRGPLLQEGPE